MTQSLLIILCFVSTDEEITDVMWQNNRVILSGNTARRRRQVKEDTCLDPNGNACEEIDPDVMDSDTTPTVSSG